MMTHEFIKFRKKSMIDDIQHMTAFKIDEFRLKHSRPGIMAQLFNNKTYELVNDFIIENDKESLHILNAVSPGWTCSFAYAEYVGEIIKKNFSEKK